MKIQSKWVDYYDHQEYAFSPLGGDPKIVYVRKALPSYSWQGISPRLPPDVVAKDSTWTFSWLVLCGSYFLIVTNSSVHRLGSGLNAKHEIETVSTSVVFNQSTHQFLIPANNWWHKEATSYYDIPDSVLDTQSKILGQPIFAIEATPTLRIHPIRVLPHIPVLSELGFASRISPNDMYQRIYTYYSNVIRDNPDLKPPVQIADKDRITQHGFDKNSFKHRKF